jgi:hypothetical protein
MSDKLNIQEFRSKLLSEASSDEVTFTITSGPLQNFFDGGGFVRYSKYAKPTAINGVRYYTMDKERFDEFLKDAKASGYNIDKIVMDTQGQEMNEMSVSGGGPGGATFQSGTGEQYSTKKAFKKESKKERGTGKGFIYKDMWEQSLNENYGRFKNETKTRGKADQFHQAIKEVRKKVQEINRVFEYVNRLKNELNEGENGLKYKKHTEAAIQKIKEMVSELNSKVKKFK